MKWQNMLIYMIMMMKIHIYNTRGPLTLSPDPRQVTRKKVDFLPWRKGMKKNETEKQSFSICFQKAREGKYVIINGNLNLKYYFKTMFLCRQKRRPTLQWTALPLFKSLQILELCQSESLSLCSSLEIYFRDQFARKLNERSVDAYYLSNLGKKGLIWYKIIYVIFASYF